MSSSRRPDPPEYADYYDAYVRLVPEGKIADILEAERVRVLDVLSGVPAETAEFRYQPGKWTLKEVLGHVVDMEWVFTYRALSFARGATQPLPDADQDLFVREANFSGRDLEDMLVEFDHLRSANVRLFASFNERILDRKGVAAGNTMSVRAIPYILAGHQIHHLRILHERYMSARSGQ